VRAIVFRQKATFEVQLAAARRIDAHARIVDARNLSRDGADQDWVLIRALDVHALTKLVSSVDHEDLHVHVEDGAVTSVTYRGLPIALTRLELRLLAELVRARGRPVSRDALFRECWDVRSTSDYTKIEAAVSRLRRKLCAMTHLYVQMDRGVGYRLVPRVGPAANRPQRGRRILLAEADMRMRRALAKHLREYTIDTATTVARTVRLLRERRYIAALVADELRDGSGLSLLPSEIPILMIVDDDAGAERARRRGANACWQKLEDPSVLRAFARRAMETQQQAERIA